jgi:hypothetical protein
VSEGVRLAMWGHVIASEGSDMIGGCVRGDQGLSVG